MLYGKRSHTGQRYRCEGSGSITSRVMKQQIAQSSAIYGIAWHDGREANTGTMGALA
jgi:hypothetical protein